MNEQRESHEAQGGLDGKPLTPERTGTGRNVAVVAVWCLFAVVVFVGVRMMLFSPTAVTTVKVQRGELRQEVFGTGTLEAKVVVGLSAKMIGKVAEVLVDQGDTVTNGQILARLEAKDFEDAVHAAESALGQAQAELAKAQLDLKRDRDLVRDKVIPQSDFDATETAYQVCEARTKNAESQLGVARARLADTQIFSPVAGLVITRNLEVGSTVVPGTPIFRVAETQVLWVQAMVDEREVGKLKIDQDARVTFRSVPGQSFPGKLARLAREADRITEEREADIIVDRLPPDWFVGAKADVYIETARNADVSQIGVGAIVRRGDQPGVFVIRGGRAKWQAVTLGLMGRETVEVVKGLEAEDIVIGNPLANKKPLADGERVAGTAAKARP
jgi:HlyD family secretion protein